MTLRHLNIFAAVCQYGTMTRAAEQLHIAQPAISATIAELERYYDVVLFDRINQRLVLTETGKELLLKAKSVLAAFAEFESHANTGKEDPSVRIGATLTIGQTLIPRMLRALRTDHPELSPHIKVCKASEVEEALLAGDLDFGLIEEAVTSPQLTRLPFARDRLAVVCGRSYPISSPVSAEELTAHPLLVREKGVSSRDLLEQILSAHHLPYHSVMESQSHEAILASAREGLGIAALPVSFVQRDLENGDLREISLSDLSLEREFYLVKYKNKRLNRAQTIAYELCRTLQLPT